MDESRDEKSNSPLKQIRTFQGDVAEALEAQKESLYSIRESEVLKRSEGASVPRSPEEADKRKEAFLLLLGSVLLLALAGAGGYYTYTEFVRKTAPPAIAVPSNRFIQPESSAEVYAQNLSRDSLFSAIESASADVFPGEVKHIVLRNGTLDIEAPLLETGEFLEKLQSRAPGSLVRALDPMFMLGALGESRFLIFKIGSFENAFAGMLNWEKNMAEDIGALFNTAPLLTNIGPESVFKDIVSRNKDVRALFAGEDLILLYSFFDNQMLIVTDSLETLRILVERLSREKLSR
jgi:hypothetical protein